ncbi:LPS-induced TNF-alpha factor [Intoshia linei]|uniref:LPS-induced TNF-alpha factor n=1 Tax=Intoshia linei TaxID=1819745 RepID=A0A177AZ71_9BILA|nr:LPS-induced TNF-alpha factor [Intoshia linei]
MNTPLPPSEDKLNNQPVYKTVDEQNRDAMRHIVTHEPPPYSTMELNSTTYIPQINNLAPTTSIAQNDFYQQPIAIGQPVITRGSSLKFRQTMRTKCPNCKNVINTCMGYESGTIVYICAMILFITGCFFLCWLPFCFKDLKDIYHRCPNCNYLISINRFM